MHVNVKPLDRNQTYETPAQAIAHLFIYGVYARNWQSAQSFGQTLNARRAIDAAVKARDVSAFIAEKRRGYWKVSLA
jgi:hypothetical protein